MWELEMSDDSDVTVEGSPHMTFAKRMEKRAKEASDNQNMKRKKLFE